MNPMIDIAIERYRNGESGTSIANDLGVCAQTLYRWCRLRHVSIRPTGTRSEPKTRLPTIIADVAKRTGVSVDDIMGRCRRADIAQARQIVMWTAHRKHGHSLSGIGRYMDRDHTTILHGVRMIDAAMASTTKRRRAA